MQPIRIGRFCITGITFCAARTSGIRQSRVVMTNTAGLGFDRQISLANWQMKQMCAMAKPPICPSKLPITPIASPIVQKQKPTVISLGISPMPPKANMTAGKTSRIANSKLVPSGLPTGTKNHIAASRKTVMTAIALFCAIYIVESFAKEQSTDDSASQ